MKKITIAALVLILVLVVAPWGIGQLAEQRVNAGLDRLVAQAPYLTIAERKWTRGWFRSEQEVTFEMFAPWVAAMHPAAASSEGAVVADPGAVAPPAPTPSEPAAPVEPIRFKVR